MTNVDVSSGLERHVAQRPCLLLGRTRVCRNLFGPVDHEELHCEMKRKLLEISERDQSRWNFNFESHSPLPGDYKWEAMTPETVPCFYKEKVAIKRPSVLAGEASDSGASETSRAVEINQENLSGALNSGPARSSGGRNKRKRPMVVPDLRTSTPQITEFFPKRKRIQECKLEERSSAQGTSSVEVTPRKTIR